MELPRLNVPVRGELWFLYKANVGPRGRLSRKGAKPGFYFERAFDGHGRQVTRSYRRKPSLT